MSLPFLVLQFRLLHCFRSRSDLQICCLQGLLIQFPSMLNVVILKICKKKCCDLRDVTLNFVVREFKSKEDDYRKLHLKEIL